MVQGRSKPKANRGKKSLSETEDSIKLTKGTKKNPPKARRTIVGRSPTPGPKRKNSSKKGGSTKKKAIQLSISKKSTLSPKSESGSSVSSTSESVSGSEGNKSKSVKMHSRNRKAKNRRSNRTASTSRSTPSRKRRSLSFKSPAQKQKKSLNNDKIVVNIVLNFPKMEANSSLNVDLGNIMSNLMSGSSKNAKVNVQQAEDKKDLNVAVPIQSAQTDGVDIQVVQEAENKKDENVEVSVEPSPEPSPPQPSQTDEVNTAILSNKQI